MAVGARDQIDRLLVQKYADFDGNCKGELHTAIDAEKMLETMNDYANVHRSMIDLHNKMKSVCAGINAKVRYSRSSLPA